MQETVSKVPPFTELRGLTFNELRWRLHTARGRRVAERTLYHWLDELRIRPDQFGLYSDEDLQVLQRLALFLRRKPSIQVFKALLREELNHADG